YVRRTVTAGPCTLTSSSILITVLPPIINNTISEDQEVCIGKSIQQLSGSVPSGGNETFSYQWQQSADGISWQNITGALSQDYQPLNLSSTTYYQRLVTSAMCTDAQKSISNTIKVIINPNAKADFTAAALTNCAPFDLSSVITGVPYP